MTQDELKSLLDYDPLTGIFRWKVNSSRARVGSPAGSNNGQGYIVIKVKGRRYRASRLAWLYVYGKWPDPIADHINRARNDNRIVNLREATYKDNWNNSDRTILNYRVPPHGDVHYRKDRNKWRARARIKGVRVSLGSFNNREQAMDAWQTAVGV